MRTASVRFAFKRDRYEVGFYAEPHAGIVQTTSGSEVRGPTHRTVKAKSMQCTRVLTGGGIEHAAALPPTDQADGSARSSSAAPSRPAICRRRSVQSSYGRQYAACYGAVRRG